MKKTLRTALTAAVFAAANLSAMPSMAAGDSSGQQGEEVGNLTPFSFDDWVRITDQTTYDLYGVPPTFDPNQFSNADWMNQLVEFSDLEETVTTVTTTTTTTPVTLYGPMLTTTVSEEDWDTVVTTLTTVMIPQPAYGAPEINIGDANSDGTVDSMDAVALRRMLITGDGTMDERIGGDINCDGKISISDLLILQKYLLGKVKNLDEYRSGYYYGAEKIEKITTTAKDNDPVVTTETIGYDPVKDIVVSLYGIKPVEDRISDMIFNDNTDQEK